MTCPRGTASPDAHTQRKLFAASGGYCQNPECPHELFIDYPEQQFHIAEMAHIFAANDDGPRANLAVSQQERGSFDNLILLCPLCHTKIDKAPGIYSDRIVFGWKRQHAEKLRSLFGVTRFDSRADARAAIECLLRENRKIFEDYGPNIEAARNPESGADRRWRRKVLQKIIPNNRKLLSRLDANKHLMNDNELIALDEFRQHIDDLEARHIEGYSEGASQFPRGMADILRS